MKDTIKKLILIVVVILTGCGVGAGGMLLFNQGQEEVKTEAEIELAPETKPAVIEGDQGELIRDDTIPTVEEVDGGGFRDINTGVSAVEGQYTDLGWAETYDVSSPQAFKDATIGKCVIAQNYFGAQCVSLARVYWWGYANRDVSTCGTGAAKGMMNCWQDNAGDSFETYWKGDVDKIQAGDWLVFEGGQYGHVGMALGPVVGGYVALLGENQGGKACAQGGAATNIINMSVKNLIGFYRPKAYIQKEPEPAPQPAPEPTEPGVVTYTYKKGDYFSKVLKKLGLDEGKLWGKDGTVAYYTKQLIKQDMLDSRGNVKIGKEFVLSRR